MAQGNRVPQETLKRIVGLLGARAAAAESAASAAASRAASAAPTPKGSPRKGAAGSPTSHAVLEGALTLQQQQFSNKLSYAMRRIETADQTVAEAQASAQAERVKARAADDAEAEARRTLELTRRELKVSASRGMTHHVITTRVRHGVRAGERRGVDRADRGDGDARGDGRVRASEGGAVGGVPAEIFAEIFAEGRVSRGVCMRVLSILRRDAGGDAP